MAKLQAIAADQKYISLETFRRSGAGVRTPVWFATAPDAASPRYYVFTTASSGKAKRIRNDAKVRVAVCNARGAVTGAWVEAHAETIAGAEATRAMKLLGGKYWPLKQMLDLSARISGRLKERIVLAIEPS